MQSIVRVLSLVGFSSLMAFGQVDFPKVPMVNGGYHAEISRISIKKMGEMIALLAAVPASFPQKERYTVERVWHHLNYRLATEKSEVKVLFEVDSLSVDEIERYLRAPIHSFHGHRLDDKGLRSAFEKANCEDLLNVIVENSGLEVVYRNGAIILGPELPNE